MWQSEPDKVGLYWAYHCETKMITTASVLDDAGVMAVVLGDTPWNPKGEQPRLRLYLNDLLGRGLLFYPANVPAPPGATAS